MRYLGSGHLTQTSLLVLIPTLTACACLSFSASTRASTSLLQIHLCTTNLLHFFPLPFWCLCPMLSPVSNHSFFFFMYHLVTMFTVKSVYCGTYELPTATMDMSATSQCPAFSSLTSKASQPTTSIRSISPPYVVRSPPPSQMPMLCNHNIWCKDGAFQVFL